MYCKYKCLVLYCRFSPFSQKLYCKSLMTTLFRQFCFKTVNTMSATRLSHSKSFKACSYVQKKLICSFYNKIGSAATINCLSLNNSQIFITIFRRYTQATRLHPTSLTRNSFGSCDQYFSEN